jgi:beta-fructofuranosidase
MSDSRAELARDPHRPGYHFLPPANWMNDPNGLIQWRGRYHLFYQHNPFAPVWGSIHWGHAASDDLVHWQDLPLALEPTPGGVDADGVFSGCAVDNDGVATVVYTGVRDRADKSRLELPCLATSTDDDLRTWHKHPGNPVITAPPQGFDVLGFRDHCVWRETAGDWYQLIGSGIHNTGGTAFVYRSSDLERWEFVHPLLIGDSAETGTMWECPDLFPVDDAHVLVVSPIPLHKALYAVGHLEGHRFTPQQWAGVDEGGYLYAPQSFSDRGARRIMLGWLREGRDEAAQRSAGWAGVMSLPRVLTLVDGRVHAQPAPELQSLRRQCTSLREVAVDTRLPVDVHGQELEVVAEIEPRGAAEVGLLLRCSPDGQERTEIVYDTRCQRLTVDRQRSSLDSGVHRAEHSAELRLESGEMLRLQVFVDHSVIEIFANGHTSLSTRVYPTRADSLGVELFAVGGAANLTALDAWQLSPIWPLT